jgi:uncharacterized membrane protein (GlpM family)
VLLALKLCLVPGFIFLVSLAGRRWGASIAGWLAGLPVVAGPILWFLCLEQGPPFAANAALASLSAVFASMCYCLAYAHIAQRAPWPIALCGAFVVWAAAALSLSQLPPSAGLDLGIAILALALAPPLFPPVRALTATRTLRRTELGLRMALGALLTVVVSAAAQQVGQMWSGLLAVFPVMSTVLAVFSQATQGPQFASTLLRAMAFGMYSFAAFCFLLATTLTHLTIAGSFIVAVVGALIIQVATRRFF